MKSLVVSKPNNQILRILRYGFSVAIVALAFLLSRLFWVYIGESPFIFFFGAIALSAWFGGLVPGLISTGLSVFTVDYFLLEPVQVMLASEGDIFRLGIFAGLSFLISWLSESRQRTEEALRTSRDQLQVILDSVADGITAQDNTGKAIFANEAAAQIMGYPTARQMVGSSVYQERDTVEFLDTEDDNPLPRDKLPDHAVRTQGIRVEQNVCIRYPKTGEKRWLTVKSTPIFDEAKRVHLVINVLRDITEVQKYENNLREQHERFQVTLVSITDAVITTDTEGIIDFMNPVAENYTGWSKEEAVGRRIKEVITLTDEETQDIVTDIFNHNSQHQLLVARNGEKLPVKSSAAPLKNINGENKGAVIVFRDVKRQRDIERIRDESNQRLRDVLDNLAAFVGLMKPDGTLIEANRRALDAANLTADDVLGLPFEETYWWNYDEKVKEKLRETIRKAAGGETVRYDARIRVSDGGLMTIDFILAPIFDSEGAVTHLVPSGIDITHRKQAEFERATLTHTIEMQRQHLKKIVANVPGVVWEAWGDPESTHQRIDFVSDYVEPMLGYTVEDWLDTPNFWLTIVHPDDQQRAAAESHAIYESGGEGVVEFRWITRDGRVIPVEARSAVIVDEQGKPIGMRGVTMDISERKRAEKALVEYAHELARSNEELQQFAYVASHDLQEPLRMVTSYLQLVEQRYKDVLDEEAHEFIDFAVDGATRMKTLINDLLAYSRVGTRGKEFKLTHTQDILEQALFNLHTKIEDSDAVITYDSLPEIMVDKAQFVQLFQNLIGNAIKFSGDKRPEIHIGVEQANDEWRFCIRDNGIGIDDAYRDRIFVLFQRLHTIDEYEGTGIGLAICKRVIERHKGQIWLESQPGHGTTFYFTVPANQKGLKEYADASERR